MAIKHCIISSLKSTIDVDKLLHVFVVVFHVVSLAYVGDYAGVEALNHELEAADAESVAWQEAVTLVSEQHLVEAAGLLGIEAEVSELEGAQDAVEVDLEVVLRHLVALELHKAVSLAGLGVLFSLAEDERKLLRVKAYSFF